MKPQSEAFLEKANELLGQAEIMLGVGLADAAGRTAYLAGFHAAQALIFERTGKVGKTHSGVHSEFGRLSRSELAIDQDTRAFLGSTYNLKAVADYETGPGSKVPEEKAAAALSAARSFVTDLANMIAGTMEQRTQSHRGKQSEP